MQSCTVSFQQYRFSSSLHQLPTLQYDDTCLTASTMANCQATLNTTQKWLDWSLLKAKVLKCASISICGQTGQCTNPHLSTSDERIPFLGSNSISFLGLPVNAARSTYEHIKDQIQTKQERYLHATDQSPLSRQQKLRICGQRRNPSSPVMAPFPHRSTIVMG